MFVKLSILVLYFGAFASAIVFRRDADAGAPLSGPAGPSCADIKSGLFAPDGMDSPSWFTAREVPNTRMLPPPTGRELVGSLITRLIKNEYWINPTREADVSIWAVQADGKIEKAESKVTYDSVAETGISSTDTKKAWWPSALMKAAGPSTPDPQIGGAGKALTMLTGGTSTTTQPRDWGEMRDLFSKSEQTIVIYSTKGTELTHPSSWFITQVGENIAKMRGADGEEKALYMPDMFQSLGSVAYLDEAPAA